MSFDPLLRGRWENVISPGLVDAGLEPHRVDASRIGDSIITEITQQIGSARIFFADITAIGNARNGNVMYEVGLAHAVRAPQEVVLFRSDSDRLLFDISPVRVHSYSPEGEADKARKLVTDVVTTALKEVELTRLATVQRITTSLDPSALGLLMAANQATDRDGVNKIVRDHSNNVHRARGLARLLELALLQVEYPSIETAKATVKSAPNLSWTSILEYAVTPLGKAVYKAMLLRFVEAERSAGVTVTVTPSGNAKT